MSELIGSGTSDRAGAMQRMRELESRLAEREKELADAKELSEGRLQSWQKAQAEIERLRGALEEIAYYATMRHEAEKRVEVMLRFAKAALERRDEGEGAPVKEILYTGQCRHQIPIGQHCQGCNR